MYIGKIESAARDKNWHEAIKRTRNICNLWQARGLTIRGKVKVSNVLVLSTIVHGTGVMRAAGMGARN